MASPSYSQGKLPRLSERFGGYERARDMVRNSDTAVDEISGSVARLEQQLDGEIQRRTDTHKAMQVAFEAQVARVQESLESLFLERYDNMHSALEAMSDRVGVVEKDFAHSREKYICEMEEKSGAVDQDVSSFRSAFDQEMAVRADREGQLHRKVQLLEAKTAEKLDHERQIFEHKFSRLRDDFEEAKRVRDEQHARYEADVAAELQAVTGATADAKKMREQADDDIVSALNHYTRSLQEALRSASTQALRAIDGAGPGTNASAPPVARLRG